MSKIRIAFFDIDGTLLDFGSREPSLKMKETLLRLKENGIILCIATGRAPLSLPSFALTGFDAYLTFNGSLCYTGNMEILSNPLFADDIMRIVRNAAGIGRPVSIATRDRFIANGMDDDLKAYYGISGSKIVISIRLSWRVCAMRESLHGGIGQWISFRQMEARALQSPECSDTSGSLLPNQLLSAMAVMISGCCRPSVQVLQWGTPLQISSRWQMMSAALPQKMASIPTASSMG